MVGCLDAATLPDGVQSSLIKIVWFALLLPNTPGQVLERH
jgi:hypothetical protein